MIELEGTCTILTNRHLGNKVLDIIENSEEYCFIVTPFFRDNDWPRLKKCLKDTSVDKKRILFILSKPSDNIKNKDDEQKKRDNVRIEAIKKYLKEYNFDLYFVENLHSKIYLNEKEVLITSMNLQNYADDNNHEIGCYFKDPVTSRRVVSDVIFKQILKDDKKDYVEGMWSQWLAHGHFEQFLDSSTGYCIKCKSQIPYNEKNPVCDNCSGDAEMAGKHCHKCGNNNSKGSKERPLCLSCYTSVRNKSQTNKTR